MLSKRYTFSELNKILAESQNEFSPRIGDGVESKDKQNNGKAVDDIMKQSKEFDGGITGKKKNTNKEDVQDFNKTTLDLKFASEPGEAYEERVKALVHGFPSAENKKNGIEKDKSLDYDGNSDFYDAQKKKSKEVNDIETDIKHAGLKARELPKDNFKNDTLFKNENKAMKRLHFKNTVFLSEAQMLKKVPEEFKSANGKFIMKDASGTEYLVECDYNKEFKFGKLSVINKMNNEQINEQLDRMRELFDYNSSKYMGGTTTDSRKGEAKGLSEMIDRMKKIEADGLND